MTSRVLLYLGPDDSANVRAHEALKRIPNVDLSVVAGMASLSRYVPMPFIDAPDGNRYHGNQAIESFLTKSFEA